MSNRPTLQKLLPVSALGLGFYLIDCNTAQAFFPPLPTGNQTPIVVEPPTPPVIIPINPNIPARPEPTVPPFVPPPTVPPVPPMVVTPPPQPPSVVTPVVTPPEPCGCPVQPQTVPEPMTLLSGLFGAMTVGGYVVSRRLSPKKK